MTLPAITRRTRYNAVVIGLAALAIIGVLT